MNTNMDGKKVKAIYFPDGEGGNMKSGEHFGEFHLSATHHGDHDEFWIVQTKDGEEVARFNPRYLESIEWA